MAEQKISFFDHKFFPVFIGMLCLIVAGLVLYFIDFRPGLSHLSISVYSGAPNGNYYAQVARAAKKAESARGRIENISTNGSVDNVGRISGSTGVGTFALVQDGMSWKKRGELIAYLPSPETVFFLGPDADKIRNLADLRNLRIGIGPQGSGTAHAAERIFGLPQFAAINARLSYHTADEQLRLLKKRELDLGVFVIGEKSAFMEKAIGREGMQIADIRQAESISARLPFLRVGSIPEGFYDPIQNVPHASKKVLKVYTLIVSNGNARRSAVMGLLSVFSGLHPGFINFNRSAVNYSGLPESPAAREFFNNQGPEILDRYAPRLMDLFPLSNLVQIAMGISILFNVMGAGNRFRLWRIDANRLAIENDMRIVVQGGSAIDDGIRESLIARHRALADRCRAFSQSMLVPMGAEMSYRYQEEIIERDIAALREHGTGTVPKDSV